MRLKKAQGSKRFHEILDLAACFNQAASVKNITKALGFRGLHWISACQSMTTV